MPLRIGIMVDARYRITERIGHGGMAEVYEAHDIISRRTVAIKIIREDVMANSDNIKRFLNEATIAASMSHPNIVKILYHGVHEGRPYIVNEYIAGQTLKDVLDFRSFIPLIEVLSIMIQLTSALSYAHSHNVIHRDIKPQNIFLLPDGTIKLCDFGIAEASGVKTVDGNSKDIIGSVHYLAPEIAMGKAASIYTDIYAAGVTFFELLTGHVPFNSSDAISVAASHIHDNFPSVRKYIPNCPREVERIIFKACAKNPKERYHNASDFYDALVDLKNKPSKIEEKKSLLSRIFGFK